MNINDFITKFCEAVEIEDAASVKPETLFRELDEWSSLSTLSVIAMADEEFGFELDPDTFKKAQTVEDLYNICTAG